MVRTIPLVNCATEGAIHNLRGTAAAARVGLEGRRGAHCLAAHSAMMFVRKWTLVLSIVGGCGLQMRTLCRVRRLLLSCHPALLGGVVVGADAS
jgi:hypothetical protein